MKFNIDYDDMLKKSNRIRWICEKSSLDQFRDTLICCSSVPIKRKISDGQIVISNPYQTWRFSIGILHFQAKI